MTIHDSPPRRPPSLSRSRASSSLSLSLAAVVDAVSTGYHADDRPATSSSHVDARDHGARDAGARVGVGARGAIVARTTRDGDDDGDDDDDAIRVGRFSRR